MLDNSKRVGEALYTRGISALGAHKQFTCKHQIILDVSRLGGGLKVARLLEQANIITNKNLIPCDTAKDWNHPGGIRIGTTEVTRLGMKKAEMEIIADLIAEVVLQRVNPGKVQQKSIELRRSFQKIHYCFD